MGVVMGVLSGTMIRDEIANGNIVVDPFVPEHLAPNSIDLRLGPTLFVYRKNYAVHQYLDYYSVGLASDGPPYQEPIDMKADEEVVELQIPDDGMVLWPGVLYLGSTMERIGSRKYVPAIEGRSSVARLGIHTHISAGWGDVGFNGTFTLELTSVIPVKVYHGVRVCQVSFSDLTGPPTQYLGKYSGCPGPKKSNLFRDFTD